MNDEINNSNDCREKPKAEAELIRQMGQQVVEKISDKDYRSVWRPCRPLGEKMSQHERLNSRHEVKYFEK